MRGFDAADSERTVPTRVTDLPNASRTYRGNKTSVPNARGGLRINAYPYRTTLILRK